MRARKAGSEWEGQMSDWLTKFFVTRVLTRMPPLRLLDKKEEEETVTVITPPLQLPEMQMSILKFHAETGSEQPQESQMTQVEVMSKRPAEAAVEYYRRQPHLGSTCMMSQATAQKLQHETRETLRL